MTIARLFLHLFAAAALALVAGCVGTRVNSTESTHGNVALERVLIVYRSGSFGGSNGANIAGSLGNRNLGELVPHLYARLPLAFQAQGVEARMVAEADMRATRLHPGEKLLWLQPESAYYNSRTGQALYMGAELVEPATKQTLWKAQVTMATPGFGKFDDGVADALGLQIVDQLQKAHVVVMPGAPLPATAAASAPKAPARDSAPPVFTFGSTQAPPPTGKAPEAPAPSIASGFASVEDVDAIPFLNDRGRQGYRDWLRRNTPRAFAISDDGHWSSTWGVRPSDPNLPKDPAERALTMCERSAHKPCKLYAVNGAVVWVAPH